MDCVYGFILGDVVKKCGKNVKLIENINFQKGPKDSTMEDGWFGLEYLLHLWSE